MQDLRFIIGAALAIGLGFLLWRRARKPADAQGLFSAVLPLFEHAALAPGESVGTWKLTGKYRSHFFQVQSIVDLLATRKLPSLWLMITLPEPQAITGTLDLMMRPSGPTSFSNFDFLPDTLPTPAGFPEQAVLRTDQSSMIVMVEKLRPYLQFFHEARGKEFLISPKGLRVVVLAGEADRARYGVFRDANFGDLILDATIMQRCMDALLALHKSLNEGEDV